MTTPRTRSDKRDRGTTRRTTYEQQYHWNAVTSASGALARQWFRGDARWYRFWRAGGFAALVHPERDK